MARPEQRLRTPRQGELSFENHETGYSKWVTARKLAAAEIARRVGLPLGHQVEIWLVGGVRLRGLLKLQEERLFISEEQLRHLALKVDRVEFLYREMESCVRLD